MKLKPNKPLHVIARRLAPHDRQRWADTTMRIIVLLAAALIAIPAVATDVKCTDRPECWPDTSGMYHALKRREALDAAITRLNEQFEALLKDIERIDKQDKFFAVDAEQLIQQLKTSQEAWFTYSQAHCSVEGMAGQAGSAWQNVRAHECEVAFVESRISEVESIARQIREGAGEE